MVSCPQKVLTVYSGMRDINKQSLEKDVMLG